MNLVDLAIALCGFIASAVCVFYGMALLFWLLRLWPLSEPRTQPRSRMQGGCAKHDWAGRWP